MTSLLHTSVVQLFFIRGKHLNLITQILSNNINTYNNMTDKIDYKEYVGSIKIRYNLLKVLLVLLIIVSVIIIAFGIVFFIIADSPERYFAFLSLLIIILPMIANQFRYSNRQVMDMELLLELAKQLD